MQSFPAHFFFMIDSGFSHVMTSCTIQGSPKVCTFLSYLLLDTLNKRDVFDKIVKLTNMLVEPRA
jgi:predicted membrane protein